MKYDVLLRVKGFASFEVEANSVRQARAQIESKMVSGQVELDPEMREYQILVCSKEEGNNNVCEKLDNE